MKGLHRVVLSWCLAVAWAAAAAVAQPPPADGPRPASAVVDAVGILTADDVRRLEQLAASVRQASGADLMVVVIATTEGRPHRAFATDLFNRWQLGSAERDDGLLIFVAQDDRKAEIILGDGVDSQEQVAASQRIMDRVMIPEFKRGQPGAGLRKAAFACASEILGVAAEDGATEATGQPASDEPVRAVAPPRAERGRQRQKPVDPIDAALPYALGGGGAAGGLGLSWYLVRRHLRNRPRTCAACRIGMIRLGEIADDAHLADGQKVEERLKSADYDVWTCPTCPEVTKLRYGTFFTRYARCPRCRYVTKSTTVRRIRSATTWSDGLEEINERCAQCGHAASSTRVIPRVDDRSSSSSSSSSSGGGHSSGSGASGSW